MDGRAVANFVLDYCDEHGTPVSNLSLQKLVYFLHAWHLVEFGEPLVKQSFEAWEYGPVLQYLYREFREFGKSPISSRAKRLNRFTGETEVAAFEVNATTKEFLERVLEFYRHIPPSQLVQLSHKKGGPWDTVWNHAGTSNPGMKISHAAIKEYFVSIPRSTSQ